MMAKHTFQLLLTIMSLPHLINRDRSEMPLVCYPCTLYPVLTLLSHLLKEDDFSIHSKAACQAMAALGLANMHAPHFKPGITLTDLNNRHMMFWLDGCTIMHYVAPDADTVWALTRSFLHEPHGRIGPVTVTEFAEKFAKRRKLDVRQLGPRGDSLLK